MKKINSIEKEVEKMYRTLKIHWKKLQRSYNSDVKFLILKTGDYLKIAQKFTCNENIDEFVDKICKREDGGTVMCTFCLFNQEDDESIITISQVVVMEYVMLLDLIIKNMNKLKELKKFPYTITHTLNGACFMQFRIIHRPFIQ